MVTLWMGLQIPSLNGTSGSKFIVRPMSATLIRDGVAMDLQFIKNRRLIVHGYWPRANLSQIPTKNSYLTAPIKSVSFST